MNESSIKRRWYCPQCNHARVDTPPPGCKTHPVHALCGYQECPTRLQPGQLFYCEEHGRLAACTASALRHGIPAVPEGRLTGLWIYRERLRLGLSRAQVAQCVRCSGHTLYAVELYDQLIPPGWVPRLMQGGFHMAGSFLSPSGLSGRWLEAERRRRHCPPALAE